jgi:hypothetical protein
LIYGLNSQLHTLNPKSVLNAARLSSQRISNEIDASDGQCEVNEEPEHNKDL